MQHTSHPASSPAPLSFVSDTPSQISQELYQKLALFLSPLLKPLDEQIDARLVRTFLATIAALLQHRHSTCGLLLSELGGYLLSPAQAPAGTKRLSNLLRCPRWSFDLIERFLWRQASERCDQLRAEGEDVLVLWDESVVEKPESIALEGLCAVRSATAQRLKRIKPGYFNPPGGRPIFVPGWQWITLLLMGRSGPPTVAAMRWWSTRGPQAIAARTVQSRLLRQCKRDWGRRVLHVFDRGYAGGPWLELLSQQKVRFILRWPKHYKLIDGQRESGKEAKAWQLTRGQRSWEYRLLRDARHNCERKTGVYALEVRHSQYEGTLWLVVSRPGVGREPWYLLTNEKITTPEAAWKIVLAYARRWQIEMAFRYTKSELAFESPRLWKWEGRLKLLLMATLAYAFLLTLLSWPELCAWLLRHYCHRTGKRSRDTPTPLYRLRDALSRLWLSCHAHPASAFNPLLRIWLNSG